MKLPIIRIVLKNAFILSVVYLLTGIAIDSAWRWNLFHGNVRAEHLVYRLSLAIDALPARALQLLGLLGPLERAYVHGAIHEVGLRCVFEVTTLLIILVTAFFVASLMALTHRAWERPRRTA